MMNDKCIVAKILSLKTRNFEITCVAAATKCSCFSVESKLPETPHVEERIIIGGENEGLRTQSPPSRLEPEVLHKFHGKSREVGYYVYQFIYHNQFTE
jgi:hypothetical protein